MTCSTGPAGHHRHRRPDRPADNGTTTNLEQPGSEARRTATPTHPRTHRQRPRTLSPSSSVDRGLGSVVGGVVYGRFMLGLELNGLTVWQERVEKYRR
jgi:hypothetical protein